MMNCMLRPTAARPEARCCDARQAERGFTLIELSIVLVIIGLLIGGVIKGQDLIENTKTTKFLQEVEALESALTAYNGQYPGSDIYEANKTNGKWVFDKGTWAAELDEANLWAGKATGPFGGITIIDAPDAVTDLTDKNAVSPGAVCYADVPYRAAVALDNRIDDGVLTTGSVQVAYDANADADTLGKVCVSHGGEFADSPASG